MGEQHFFKIDGNASWSDVVYYLNGKYKIEEIGDKVRLGFRFADDRTQLVVVGHEDKADRTYVVITSRVGEIANSRLPKALDHMSNAIYGGLIKMGDEYFVKTCLNMNYTPMQEMDNLIGFTAKLADELEKEFVGGDEN